jgi:hypothetical protein
MGSPAKLVMIPSLPITRPIQCPPIDQQLSVSNVTVRQFSNGNSAYIVNQVWIVWIATDSIQLLFELKIRLIYALTAIVNEPPILHIHRIVNKT